jgi:hypothetical protein
MSARILALTLLVILAPQLLSLNAVAAETESCESHGLTYDCVTQTVEETQLRLPYDNGTFGTVAPPNLTRIDQTWPAQLGPNDPIPSGVSVEASWETEVTVVASNNGTVAPNTTTSPAPYVLDSNANLVPYAKPVVFALQWQARINSTVLMNGATNYYVRSPLVWMNGTFTGHILNVLDGNGRVVAAHAYLPQDHTVRALNDSLLQDRRLYYHVWGLFQSGETYTFNEYVTTAGSPVLPLSNLELAVAPHQDIDGNADGNLRIFPGSPVENYLKTLEPGYSFRFVYGTGPGGSLNLVTPTNGTTDFEIATDKTLGRGGASNTNSVDLLIPLRTSEPILGVVYVDQYNNTNDPTPIRSAFVLVSDTGSIHEFVSFTKIGLPDPILSDGPHAYRITLHLFGWNSSQDCGLPECRGITYPMTDTDNATGAVGHHVLKWGPSGCVDNAGRYSDTAPDSDCIPTREVAVELSMWVEVYEQHVDQPPSEPSQTDHNTLRLVLFATLVAGIVLIAVALVAPIAIPVIAAEGLEFTLGAIGVGLVGVSEAGGIILSDPGDLQSVFAAGKHVLAAGACMLALASPFLDENLGAKIAIGLTAAAGCYALSDPNGVVAGVQDLIDLVVKLWEVVKKALEVVGQILGDLLAWIKPIVIGVALLVLLVFAIAGVGLVKWLLVATYAAVAAVQGYERPSQYRKFRSAYQTYIPLWTELVERRLFHMEVRP